MMSADNLSKVSELLPFIQEGRVALFLGAGASHGSGAPLGKKLTEMVKEQFPLTDQSLADFLSVCQDVIDTPPYNRNLLEDFIKGKLDHLQPSNTQKLLTQYDWAAIFTTNFDDLIEVAYRTAQKCFKTCIPVYSDKIPQINVSV